MRYRNSNNTIPLLILLILIIVGIIFGFKHKNEILFFAGSVFSQITNNSNDYISLDDAEKFFYNNKSYFEEFIEKNTQTTLYIDENYISIIDRFDFGGNKIRAFRFQNSGDIGAEIIYSSNDLQESSLLRNIEKHWYVYNYVNN